MMKRWFGRAGTSADATASPDTTGHVDAIEGGRVTGWAFRRSRPERRVSVRVLVDGKAAAEDIADRYRQDLELSGRGDGRHGFTIALPRIWLDEREHVVEVIDVETGTRLPTLSLRYHLDPRRHAETVCLNRLFDPGFYEVQAGPIPAPLDHYRKTGWRQGFDPHPLFSTRHYLAHNGSFSGDPLTHFARTGQWTRAWTHPLLDPHAEGPPAANRQDDLVAASRPIHPVLAYLDGHISDERPLSRYFSNADYIERHPGIGTSGISPLSHYFVFGRREGLRPHRDFDPKLFSRLAGLDGACEPYTQFSIWLNSKKKGFSRNSADTAPDVSVIVLNYNKSILTLQCLYFLEAHTKAGTVEIIVIDNGSHPTEFELLAQHGQGTTLIRLETNRGFGEANNIGIEHARGHLLVFLNNDAFVCPGWLPPLREAIEADGVGAAGAKLLYPDGRLQEAGAMISACGTAVQRGKHLDPNLPIYNRQETVDYCSAAALMVRAAAFRNVLGFDLTWDPAYYEDADLCLKLRTIGLATVYVPRSEVVHTEHATSADAKLDLRLGDIVAVNRLKFVGRWGDWLAGMPNARPPELTRKPPDRSARGSLSPAKPLLVLFTPYPLTPGGGERYLLTIAASLRNSHRCLLLTPERYSRLRLLTIGRELGLDLAHVENGVASQAAEVGPIELFICMANELLPPMRGLGRINLYHCQFPFPMQPEQYGRGWRGLATYQGIIVNSEFTARHFSAAAEAAGLVAPPLHVLFPPVPQFASPDTRDANGAISILNVGRFSPGGHCKRQDLIIAEFKRLLNQSNKSMELHLAGAVGSDSAARAYLQQIVLSARGSPIRFHPNATAEQVGDLYARADIYWHLTGADEDVVHHPERFEHFGISLTEAMTAGAVPIALNQGGPAEIITNGKDGILIDHVRDLSRTSAHLLSEPARRSSLRSAARTRAADFAPSRFAERLQDIILKCDPKQDNLSTVDRRGGLECQS